jgi:predicted SnoaL-like aldol condensation-catalyzing enzyme
MFTPDTNRAVAEAFSGHRFTDTYSQLAPDVNWTARGGSQTVGRDAVIAACEASAREFGQITTSFLTFRSIVDGDSVAVETVGRYQEPGQEPSVVASVDLYDFADGKVRRIVSYATEIDGPVDDESGW